MTTLSRIPLTRPTLDEDTIQGVIDVLRSGWITSGPKLKEFEILLSQYCGGRPVRAFNSGTCTMEIALRIAGGGAGDEVITTPLSWVATSNVILEVGATPKFVDIDPVTRNIDLNKVSAAITPRTKAIIPVDLAGLPVNRDQLYALAKQHSLRVIEDAAQAFGSNWQGKRIGSFGDFVSFSFHANKNITTIEGGCLVMNNEAEAKLAEQYRLQGVVRSGYDGMAVEIVGGKFNLTDVAARVGIGQLAHLDEFTQRRRELVHHYFKLLEAPAKALNIGLPVADFTQSNWHMFQVVLPNGLDAPRAQIMADLDAQGVGSGVHYPAIHLFGVYQRLGWKAGDLPLAEAVCQNILTLPLYPTMSLQDVERVCTALIDSVRSHLK